MDYQGNNVSAFLQTNGHLMLGRVNNNYNLRSFTQKEIEGITDEYGTLLGEGAFGTVYKGKLDDGRPVAVKRYKNGTKKEEFAKELIVHSQINHKNVVRLLGCCTEENALMIIMEFICNGNLYNTLHCRNANSPVPFPLDKRLDIAIELAEVLSCMHSMYSPVLHGDIKPANILLDGNLRPKISDFGIARLLCTDETQHTRSIIGCIGYVDPLFCQSGILTPKSDVYSFGVVLLEMITRKKAADGNTILTQAFTEALRKGKSVLRQLFDNEIANERKNVKLLEDIAKLAAECLKMEDKMRPEMVEVADRLRAIRKVLQQRKSGCSTGSKYGLVRTEKAEDLLPSTPTGKTPAVISLNDLKEIVRNLSKSTLIGEGSHSRVFLGWLKDGQKCAVKKLELLCEDRDILEMPAVSRLKHEYVVQLIGFYVEGNDCVLAYEYASGGSLHDALHGKKGLRLAQPEAVLSWMQRVKIALSAAEGLEFLHEKAEPHIIHGNIKSSNILLFDRDVAKIGDLGVYKQGPEPEYIDNILLDRYFDNIRLDRVNDPPTSGYDAPEREAGTQFNSKKGDVYSFGVVLLELLTGRKAFDPTLPRDQRLLATWAKLRLHRGKVQLCVDRRLGGVAHPDCEVAKRLGDVVALCLEYSPDSRPDMSTVVKALRGMRMLLPGNSRNLPSAGGASGA